MILRKDQEDFLKQVQIVVLATVDAKGRPHAVPMWYLYEDGLIYMTTSTGTQKHKNIQANGKAVVVLDKRETPYYAIMAHCDAEVSADSPKDLVWRIAVRYLGEEGAERYFKKRGGGDTEIIKLKPRKLIEYHGISGRD